MTEHIEWDQPTQARIGSVTIRALRLLRVLSRVPTKLFGVMGHREILRRWCARHYPVQLTVRDLDRTLSFRCNLGEHIGSQVFWRDGYSVDESRYLDRALTSDMTFLDVGANQGELTLFAAKRLPQGQVIAMEPVSWLHARLLKNIRENGFSNIEPLPLGLGAKAECVPIYTQAERFPDGTTHVGLPSVFAGGLRTELVENIEVLTLDQLAKVHALKRLDVIKMDIEGAELDALLGGRETIAKLRPRILMELADENCRRAGHSMPELLQVVRDMGYVTHRIDAQGHLTPLTQSGLRSFQNIVCETTT